MKSKKRYYKCENDNGDIVVRCPDNTYMVYRGFDNSWMTDNDGKKSWAVWNDNWGQDDTIIEITEQEAFLEMV